MLDRMLSYTAGRNVHAYCESASLAELADPSGAWPDLLRASLACPHPVLPTPDA